jgi:predicted ferric reductase
MGRARRRARTAGRRPDPLTAAIAITLVTLGLWAFTGGLSALGGGVTGLMLAIGRLAGLLAALAALGGIVLTSRPPSLERAAGLDRLMAWHRITGMTAAFGMLVHVLATLVAAGGFTGMWTALVDLLAADWYVAALAAAILFALVAGSSWRRVRRRMTHETWHGVHLAGYLAIALAFPHQLFSGSTFVGNVLASWWWTGLYAATAWLVLRSRLGGIIGSVRRPRTEVTQVIPEAPGVVSLVVTGPGVDALAARPGQFVCLRVLTRDLWWQAHPYSLSAAPRGGSMRVTVKALGDGSSRTLALDAGTRVLLEGPYGALTIDRAEGRSVLLIGAGVGIAPMRALLEASEARQAPIVLARASSAADLPLAGELDALARARGGQLMAITGPRTAFSDGIPFTAAALRRNVADLRDGAVFVCGPRALQDAIVRALGEAGVPTDQIHTERFAW